MTVRHATGLQGCWREICTKTLERDLRGYKDGLQGGVGLLRRCQLPGTRGSRPPSPVSAYPECKEELGDPPKGTQGCHVAWPGELGGTQEGGSRGDTQLPAASGTLRLPGLPWHPQRPRNALPEPPASWHLPVVRLLENASHPEPARPCLLGSEPPGRPQVAAHVTDVAR